MTSVQFCCFCIERDNVTYTEMGDICAFHIFNHSCVELQDFFSLK